MKKMMKQSCLMVCVVALLLSVSGCMPATTEKVLTKADQWIAGRSLTAATVDMDLTMTVTLGGEAEEIAMHVSADTKIGSGSNAYGECDYAITVGAEELGDSVQVYNTVEDGKLVTFTHVDSPDAWYRTETALPTGANAATGAFLEELGALVLEEDTQTLNDREVYVLTGTPVGDGWKALLTNSANVSALMDLLKASAPEGFSLSDFVIAQTDLPGLSAEMTLYVDKRTCEPVQVDLTIEGMDSLLPPLLSALPKSITSALGVGVFASPIQVVCTDLTFDPVELPEVPEVGRIQGAQAAFQPDRGDGTYVIQNSGDAVQFAPLESWTVTGLAYNYVSFATADKKQTADFELYAHTTPEEFVKLVEDGIIPALKALELEVTSQAGSAIGDYQTHVISARGVNIYLAYRVFGDSLLGIYVQDTNSGADLTATMTPILESIQAYDVEF